MLVLVMRFWICFLSLALLCSQNLLFLGMQVNNLGLLDSIDSPSGILFVFIVIAAPTISHVPMSPGASVILCPIGESFATLIRISFCFIVFGLMVITPVLLNPPIVTGKQIGRAHV